MAPMAPCIAAVLAEARPVLARLELIQHGSTTNLDPTKTFAHNAETALLPQGESNPPHLIYRDKITNAASEAKARDALDQARQALHSATMRTLIEIHEETLAELKARIVTDGVGWAPREVSLAIRCTERFVRTARTEAGRNPDTGHALPPEGIDRWTWAAELRSQGITIRQIAMLTGIPRSTLADRL